MGNASFNQEVILTPSEAALGTKKLVTIGSRRLEVSIPPGVSNGTAVRLRNALNYGDTFLILVRIQEDSHARPFHPSNNFIHRIPAWGKWAIGAVIAVSALSVLIIMNLSTEVVVPTDTLSSPVRLPTGTYLVNKLIGGLGELTVENGSTLDAVVTLSRPEQPKIPLIAVYIQARASHTVTGINDGSYMVFFQSGEDWDVDSNHFMRRVTLWKFEENLVFSTTSRQYTTYQLSLQPVVGGTARTEPVSEYDFPDLSAAISRPNYY